MTEAQIRQTIFTVLRGIAPEIDPAKLDPATGLREQVDLDSMDLLNVIAGFEQQLGVRIPEADYPALVTLDGCVAYLRYRLTEAGKQAD